MHSSALPPRVTAVLGPTNTGKTHFAIERMLAHASGVIGLPLRLLAREVYDKILTRKSKEEVALITGEEKIVPAGAKYYVCTVEAMPTGIGAAFLAVDEIQLCADATRGHVFTDRLLNARGEEETIFMGADTMRSAIRRFVPEAHFLSRTRFSDLAYTGAKKLTRLPRRAAVIGFSADDVYAIADLIRTQRGGAAVVLGALSPRTRNAQVQLYQSGEVDFLVATDAIGMGLNMDVDHVAFASLTKFDGSLTRMLRPEEMGQIAGRAGRHMNDGTFGVTADAEALDAETVSRIENHHYDPVRVLQWRGNDLRFTSLDALLESLDAPPPGRGLVKARPASDLLALQQLSRDEEMRARATHPDTLRLLWDCCQVPDFLKLSAEEHARLVRTLFSHLSGGDGVLPEDWFAAQVNRLDQCEGDVAALSGRLAHIRTWTYAAHRPGWLKDAGHWQNQTRAIEDRLSDALHERLTQRFIDRRTSVLMRSIAEDVAPLIDDSGGVTIGGECVGKLDGFLFTPACGQGEDSSGLARRTLHVAAMKGLESEFAARAARLASAPDDAITLSDRGRLWWEGAIVAKLAGGPSPLKPTVHLLADETVQNGARQAIQSRLESWLKTTLDAKLELMRLLEERIEAKPGSENALPAEARAIAHRLCEQFGALANEDAALPDDKRGLIRALKPHVWFGRRSVYLPKLLRPEAAGLLALLWSVWNHVENIPALPRAGLTSFLNDTAIPEGFLAAAGYRLLNGRAVRLDMLERLEETLQSAAVAGLDAPALMPKLVSLLGCGNEEMRDILAELGWNQTDVAHGAAVFRRAVAPPPKPKPAPQPEGSPKREPHADKPKKHAKPQRKPAKKEVSVRIDPNSPFAGLAVLLERK